MSQKKTKVISVRASEDEIKSFELQAKALGLSRGAYLRQRLQGLPISPTIVPPVNWQIYKELGEITTELRSIGNNITKVTKEDSEEIQVITDQIQQLQRLIRETRLEITGSKN